MCQLTFSNLNDKVLNRLYITTQLLINTNGVNHKDGFGIFHNWKIKRNVLPPSSVSYFGRLIREAITEDYPVLAHVRHATYTNRKKEVILKHTHPFQSKNYVLAHNGTLEFKDVFRMDDAKYKELIDSQIFLHRLQEVRDSHKNKDIQELLKLTMEEFRGKFAFIIFDKTAKHFYFARGTSAKLHMCYFYREGEKIGYVINTDIGDLKKAVELTVQNYATITGDVLTITELKILMEESVLDSGDLDIINVGEIKETKIPFYTPVITPGYRNIHHNAVTPVIFGVDTMSKDDTVDNKDLILLDKFLTETSDLNLSIEEIDELIICSVGSRILELVPSDMIFIMAQVLPLLKKEITSDKKSRWDAIRNKYFNPIDAYNDLDLQFPYMFNNISLLRKKWRGIRENPIK